MENEKRPVIRTCVVCRKKFPKESLMRVVRDRQGNIAFDKKHRLEGRGAYICSEECLTRLQRVHGLERAYKTSVSQETYRMVEDTAGLEEIVETGKK